MATGRKISLKPTAAILAALAALWFFASTVAAQQTSPYTLYQHKALYLYNFAKYTEWPKETFADTNAPFVIGVLGQDPFGTNIDIIKDKTIKGRRIEILKCSTIAEATTCHILFIASSETKHLPQILEALENTSVLTVAEYDGFLEANGIINMVSEQKENGAQTVRFEINRSAAEKLGLKLDTQLLKLARRVKS